MKAEKVIIEPILTEKSNGLRESKKYSFVVHPSANKIQIAAALKTLFDVNATAVNVIKVKGKPRRSRGVAGYTSSWKKAVVTLPENETIAVFEGA